jgi:hypothetical protein
LLTDGRVLFWDDLGDPPQVWNPETSTFDSAPAPSAPPSGMAQVVLEDGNVVLLGGHDETGSGLTTVWEYDASAQDWSVLPALVDGRNEPTAILMDDANILALSGETAPSWPAAYPERAAPGAGWVRLSLAQRVLPNRPWGFVLSTGNIAVVGPDRTARRLDPSAGGDWHVIDDMLLGSRSGGTAVLVPGAVDRMLIVGGRSPATASCEILDLATSLNWRQTASMHAARRHHNATVLADGSVLVTGGTLIDDTLEYAVYTAERFDPVLETWSLLDSMTVSRRRGSVALLLQDGRVLVSGGGDGSEGSELHANAEIYSPPYLFAGPRPLVTASPDSVAYGDSLVVTTPDDSIAAVWLVRAGAVSGGFNADQRALSLVFVTAPGEIHAVAPDSAGVAPPGPYLLFLVHETGAVSEGRFVRLFAAVDLGELPTITSIPPMSGSVGSQYVYDAEASGAGPITWSLVDAPSWLQVNSDNGIVTGIPTAEEVFLVTLRASNAAGSQDQAWGIDVGGTPRTLVPIGATWRYFKGLADPGTDWVKIAYDDASWLTGPSGFGFGDNDDATVLDDMEGSYTTVYTRRTFTLFETQSVTRLSLRYDYDDGFAAYLNGSLVFSQQAPTPLVYTSIATSSHEATHVFETQPITDPGLLGLLQEGVNVLAVVGLNRSLGSSDLTLRIELEVTGGADAPVDVGESLAGLGPMGRAFPNPFVTSTSVRFAVASAGAARFEIFDVRGRRLQVLEASRLLPGSHVFEWNGRDAQGRAVVPGIYFYRLHTPDGERRGKIVRSFLGSR